MLRVAAFWTALAVACIAQPSEATASVTREVRVEGGEYRPLYGEVDTPIAVAPYWIDVTPVTNAQFLAFVERHARWRRGAVPKILADEGYLAHWAAEPGPPIGNAAAPAAAPVTHVSWFAARAYCRALGRRLPTTDEWEFVARADEHEPDASDREAFRRRILDWYGAPPDGPPPEVGSVYVNVWGVADLHGSIWEWVEDFLSLPVTGESRGDDAVDRDLYCAGASTGASDRGDYGAFLRYAMRASMDGRYTSARLGFRCARDAAAEGE